MPITRRNMLTGAAAAFALPSVPALADTAPLRTIPSTGARVPAVGDTVDVRVRYTATTFDRIVVT